jgi:hypothetical protein
MSTAVEQMPTGTENVIRQESELKPMMTTTSSSSSSSTMLGQQAPKDKQQHPLHQFDISQMTKLYETCMMKMSEHEPEWNMNEWTKITPMPKNLSADEERKWKNPTVFSSKQVVLEAFQKLARESGEPMILMPNFDYGDILNFERFLQALKMDGINAITKYKQYLNNKDMRKMEVDLVIIHAKYGVILFEIKDCDHFDAKRRSRARIQLNNASNCFKSMGKLIFEAKGWTSAEASVPIIECIALPYVEERPMSFQQQQKMQTTTSPADQHNQSTSSTGSATATTEKRVRILNYLMKGDLTSSTQFAQWWKQYIVDAKSQRDAENPEKVNKFDMTTMNCMLGLITCVRNNSIMPVVTNSDAGHLCMESTLLSEQMKSQCDLSEEEKVRQQLESEKQMMKDAHLSPAMNIKAEFFNGEHEKARAHSKVVVCCKDMDLIRKTVCKQILWMLLNDHQKKISVVCSEMNKPYYEEYFARQRKIYSSCCTNVRFYTDLESCTLDGQHNSPLFKKEVETWFFDCALNRPLEKVMERVRELSTFWMFTNEEEKLNGQFMSDLESMKAKFVRLDKSKMTMPLMNETSFKLPLRLQCDVLIIGDIVSSVHLKNVYRLLGNNRVSNYSSLYNQQNVHHNENIHDSRRDRHHNNNYNNHHQQQFPTQNLGFNPLKRFKSIKFIRGGSIDNIRNSLKMHDSIQASVVLMHVGDEDLFKTRSAVTTTERVKELANLVREYCPKSFCLMSTLMKRNSRTENMSLNDVNKGIVNFCKLTKESSNFFYMLNTQFDSDSHTQEGRCLNNKGLQLYIDNFLFCIDHYMIRNNKQK